MMLRVLNEEIKGGWEGAGMIVWEYEGLLLRPTKTKKGQYRRVGTLGLGEKALETAGQSMRTVTLEDELYQAVENMEYTIEII